MICWFITYNLTKNNVLFFSLLWFSYKYRKEVFCSLSTKHFQINLLKTVKTDPITEHHRNRRQGLDGNACGSKTETLCSGMIRMERHQSAWSLFPVYIPYLSMSWRRAFASQQFSWITRNSFPSFIMLASPWNATFGVKFDIHCVDLGFCIEVKCLKCLSISTWWQQSSHSWNASSLVESNPAEKIFRVLLQFFFCHLTLWCRKIFGQKGMLMLTALVTVCFWSNWTNMLDLSNVGQIFGRWRSEHHNNNDMSSGHSDPVSQCYTLLSGWRDAVLLDSDTRALIYCHLTVLTNRSLSILCKRKSIVWYLPFCTSRRNVA